MENNLTEFTEVKDILASEDGFFERTLSSLAEFGTGVIKLGGKEGLVVLGNIIQQGFKKEAFKQIHKEYKKIVKSGKVNPGYRKSPQAYACFQEMIYALDNGIIDQERIDLIRKIFFASLTETTLDRNDPRPQQYMKIAGQLTSGEIILLLANYREIESLNQEFINKQQRNLSLWLDTMAEKTGLGSRELVESFEETLIKKRLLSSRNNRQEAISLTLKTYRLSKLGFDFCEYYSK